MHVRTQLIIFGILLLIAGRIPVHGEDYMVRWVDQRDDGPSRAPVGELLYPLPDGQYWGPADNCGALVTEHAGGSLQSITFETEVKLTEITLRVAKKVAQEVIVEPPAITRLLLQPTEGGIDYGVSIKRLEPDEVIPTVNGGEKWIRIRLHPEEGKSWRISLQKELICKDVVLWGSQALHRLDAVYAVPRRFMVASETIPGAKKTTVTDQVYWAWQRALITDHRMESGWAVWAQHDKWARICASPVLPTHDAINQPLKIVMARNEYEGALLTLTSLQDTLIPPKHESDIYRKYVPGYQEHLVAVSDIRGPSPEKVKLVLRVAATIHSQVWGTVVGPLFSSDNMLGTYQFLKYFTNGRMIADYPRIALQPCASQVFWLEVKTDDAEPGTYTARLDVSPGPSLPIEIEVLPVTLPSPRTWVFGWSHGAVGSSWPFAAEDVLERTVSDKLSRGISCFRGVPDENNEPGEARRQNKDVYFLYNYLIPKFFVGTGYGANQEAFQNPPRQAKEGIEEHLMDVVNKYRVANVDYDSWSGELWYAPGDLGAPLIGMASAWVKAINPQVNVFVNPAFPAVLQNFREMSHAADIFVPFWGNWFQDPEWREQIMPGRINAFYAMQGSNLSELHEEVVGHRRILPWHAFILELQGWGFNSYYSQQWAWQGDPYADYRSIDEEPNYALVYPGPRGPVPSRQAEALRDGWEDYRLLILLAESKSPKAKEAIEAATAQIPMDREPPTAHIDFEEIRLRLLRVAAELAAESKH